MGNDGGSIPKRRELVKEAARAPTTAELKETQAELQSHAWSTCPLSSEKLVPPIVSDCSGKLYNKDAILQFLIPSDAEDFEATSLKREQAAFLAGRVSGLRDVVEVKFTLKHNANSKKFECPVTGRELGPSSKSVYLVPCGHAFHESAIAEVSESSCLTCTEPFEKTNVIPILPVAKADVEKLIARAEKLKADGLAHSLKKLPGMKKRKKEKVEADVDGKATITTTENVTKKSAPSINNSATASLTSRVLAEGQETAKRRKLGPQNENLQTLFSNRKDGKGAVTTDFMTRGFTIPTAARQ